MTAFPPASGNTGSSAPRPRPWVTGAEDRKALKRRARRILAELARLYPEAPCALDYTGPYQLLVATILSAQCTDRRINMVTPALFARYPDAATLAAASPKELEELIRTTGFFRNKAKNLIACFQGIVTQHGGQVPGTMNELTQLPGIGRKTANVVLCNCFDVPGIPVDTHVGRLSQRMGLTVHADPVKIEADLNGLIPRNEWTLFGHRLIYHGRQVCHARTPLCEQCTLKRLCPQVGIAQPGGAGKN